MHYNSPNHYAQKRCLLYERLAWQEDYLKYTSDQCSGDLALVSNDGYYAVPFCSEYHKSAAFALVAGEYGSIMKVPFSPKSCDIPQKLNIEPIYDAIFDLQFNSANQDELALACSDGYSYILDLKSEKLISSFNCEELVKRARYMQSNILVTGGASGKIQAWDTRSLCKIFSTDAHSMNGKGSVTSFICLNEYEIASIGTPDYRIKFWDLRNIKSHTRSIESMSSKRERAYTALDYSDGYLYACNTNNIIVQYNRLGVATGTFSAPNYTSFSFYTKLQILKDKKTLASSSGNGQIFLWDIGDSANSTCISMGTDQPQEVTAFSECTTRDELLIASEDGSIRIWNKVNNSNERAQLVGTNYDLENYPMIEEINYSNNSHGNCLEPIIWPHPYDVNYFARSFTEKENQSLILDYCESSSKRPRLK